MVRLVLLILMIAAFGASSVGFAEQTTLTIVLPEAGDQQTREEARGTEQPSDENQAGGRQFYTSIQSSSNQSSTDVAVGRVGVITSPRADIKSAHSTRSRTLFSCPKDTYLAIIREHKNWYGVLMIDSSIGWIEKRHVNLLNYKVMGNTAAPSDRGGQIVQTALKYLGIPYRWGGTTMQGLDCSGFVKDVFARHGINLPRVSRDQSPVGTAVGMSQLLPGDRLYFATRGREVDHVGIYIGNGLFIHSSRSRGGVVVDEISTPLYLRSLVTARRS